MIARSVKDQPEIILEVNYHAYVERVKEYWNGTPAESVEEPYGIALLQSKITELEKLENLPSPAFMKNLL